MVRDATWWQNECEYISQITDKKGYVSEFNCDAEVFIRYCEMQRNQAKRDGVFDAMEYIQHCIDDMKAGGGEDV